MSFRGVSTWLAALFVLSAGAASAEDYDPFRVPRPEVLGVVDRIALWPVRIPYGLTDEPELAERVELLLTSALGRLGYDVVPSSVLATRWRSLSEQLGGVFDPMTGKADEERLRLLRDLVYGELAIERGVDAFLFPSLSVGSLSLWAKTIEVSPEQGGGRRAVWMAVREPILWQGRPVESRWSSRPTRVVGPRLGIELIDAEGQELYDVMVAIRYARVYAAGSYEDRTDAPPLATDPRLVEVVDQLVEALDPASAGSAER